MIYAEKGNKLKRISESDISKCLAEGFTIVDDKGTVLHQAVPNDVPSLKLAFAKQQEEIKSLKGIIANQNAEIQRLQQQVIDLAAAPSTKSSDSEKTSTPRRKKAEAAVVEE